MNYAQLVQDVLDGNESGLKALAILKELDKDVKEMIKQVEPVAIEEAAKYAEKSFEFQEWKFEKRNGAKRYDFKHIHKWNEAKQKVTEIETEAKQAYAAYENNILTATQEGEEIELPKVTYSKDSIVIKEREGQLKK